MQKAYNLPTESRIQCIMLLGLLCSKGVYGFEHFAGRTACDALMQPKAIKEPNGHGEGTLPQTTPTLYELKMDKTSVKSGEQVEMTVSGKTGDTFRGFMILVRKQVDDKAVYGRWADGGGDGDVQEKDCAPESGVSGMYACHTEKSDKKNVKVKWTAPNEAGKYDVYFTVVKSLYFYWTKMKAGEIEVTVGGPAGPGKKTSAAHSLLIPTMLLCLPTAIAVRSLWMWTLLPLGDL